jgi:hypothetical protein
MFRFLKQRKRTHNDETIPWMQVVEQPLVDRVADVEWPVVN